VHALPSTLLAFALQPTPAAAEAPRSPDPDAPTEVVAPVDEVEPDVTPESRPEPPAPAPQVVDAAPAPAGAAAPESTAPAPQPSAEEPPNPLLPKKELEIMADVPVDSERVKFKAGKGLSFESKNKRFALQIRLRAQLLYTLVHDDAEDDVEHGLQLRRARVVFGGNFFGEHNKFKTELALSPRDMGFKDGTAHQTPILDWYFEFDHLQSLTLRVGQYKVPYSRQRVVSSGDLQLVDRSLANGEFNLDRDVGFDFRSKDFMGWGKLRYYAGVYLGENRDPFETDNFELFYLGRIELLPLGMFEDYAEADFERSLKPKLSVGAAYAFVDGAKKNRGILGSTPTDGGTTDYHNVTADVVLKAAGFSFTGEFFYRAGRRNFGNATVTDDAGVDVAAPLEASRTGLGWFAQAGFLIPRLPLELAARYGQVRKLGDSSTAPVEDELGGGLSYYIARHQFKLQLDYFRLWEDQDLKLGSNVVRLQLQAGF